MIIPPWCKYRGFVVPAHRRNESKGLEDVHHAQTIWDEPDYGLIVCR